MIVRKIDWRFQIIIHFCFIFVLVNTVDAQNSMADNWRPLNIRQVKVNGEIGRRIDITINNNVLVLDADKDFLQPFKDKKLEDGYIGLGKFIDCVVRFAAYSNTSNLLGFKNHIISETVKTQEEDGYIGILDSEYRMWNLWDIHEMGYLILGLTNNYKYFKEEESLEAAEKLAQYIINRWSATPNRITNSWVSINVTTTGLEEAMLALYGQTNKQQYLDFCVKDRMLPEWDVGIIEGRWGNLEGHAYHYLSRCLAQLQLYDIQPDSGLLVNSQKAMDFLIRQDGIVIPGLCSNHECWHSNQQGFFKLGETCATAYMLRWLNTLLQMNGDSQYGDIMERIIYNGLFAAQSPDGRHLRYYSPFEGDRVYFDGDTYCCPCNYRRIIAELPGMIYYQWNEGLAINLFTESTASFNLNKDVTLNIRQETDYPNSGKVIIYINPGKTTEFPLRLRIPRWCHDTYISINGESFDVKKQGGFITLDRKWRKGDKIELEMSMSWRLVKGRKAQSGRVAVMRGPQLFCLNPNLQENFNPDIMRLIAIDPTSLKLSNVDSLIRPNGLTCQAYFWDPNNYSAQSKAPIKLLLTEYADPGCQATYFLIRNPNSDIFVDDELFGGYGN